MSGYKGPLLFSLIAIVSALGPVRAGTFDGTSGQLNGSAVTAFADVTGNQVNSVGFQVSGDAVRNPGAGPGELFLTLPSQAAGTGFAQLGLEWNPQGHEPSGVYDLPHFDLHFYYIPEALRTTIPGGQVSPANPANLPAGYSQPGPTVPMMGGHAVDLTGPEWNGGTFTQTLIYGFYQGQEIFLEPMVTQAYLEGLDGLTELAIRQPAVYGIGSLPSLVPTTIDYLYDRTRDLYTISLGGFTAPGQVPEPGSLALVALGVPAGLWFGRRRDRQSGAGTATA